MLTMRRNFRNDHPAPKPAASKTDKDYRAVNMPDDFTLDNDGGLYISHFHGPIVGANGSGIGLQYGKRRAAFVRVALPLCGCV